MFLTERFYTDLRKKQFKVCTGWFSNSSCLVLLRKQKPVTIHSTYADLTYCDNQIIQTVRQQSFGTQFLDPGGSLSAGRVRYSITAIDYKVSSYLKKQKGTAHCLDSRYFHHTTSLVIHKNNFGTSLDSNKIFLHFKYSHIVQMCWLTKQCFENRNKELKWLKYFTWANIIVKKAMLFGFTCSLVAGKDPNSLMYLSVSLASWLVYCCFCCLKPNTNFH